MSTLQNSALLQRIQVMVRSLDKTAASGVNEAVQSVNAVARKNLAGAKRAAPWTYPVPRRSRNLFINQKAQTTTAASPFAGYVFNLAPYAAAIHSGYVSRWAGRGKHVMAFHAPREFIDDAVNTVNPLMVIQRKIEQEWLTQWA